MRDFSQDHSWLSINTATVRQQRGQEWPLVHILDACARLGIRAVAPWRDQVAATGLFETTRALRTHGLTLSGYCQSGMFTNEQPREESLRALDEACELGAPCLVVIVGGLPGAPRKPAHKNIAAARAQVRDGVEWLLGAARERGMPLAIKPVHPMYAADRGCINTLEHALEVCDVLDPERTGSLGVAVDVYHQWWDPKLKAQIERAGRERLLAFQVSDWLVPTTDLLNDRGMMGDGVIDIRQIRGWVEAQGYTGYSEVEIFSKRWWGRDGEVVLKTCMERHQACV